MRKKKDKGERECVYVFIIKKKQKTERQKEQQAL